MKKLDYEIKRTEGKGLYATVYKPMHLVIKDPPVTSQNLVTDSEGRTSDLGIFRSPGRVVLYMKNKFLKTAVYPVVFEMKTLTLNKVLYVV